MVAARRIEEGGGADPAQQAAKPCPHHLRLRQGGARTGQGFAGALEGLMI